MKRNLLNANHIIPAIGTAFLCTSFFATACHQNQGATPPSRVTKTTQAEVIPSLSLGEGFDYLANEPTGEICVAVDGNTESKHPSGQPYNAFTIEEPRDLPFEVERFMTDDVDVIDYGTAVADFYDPFFESRRNQGKFVSLLVTLPTVTTEITEQSLDDPDAACVSNPPEDFNQFVLRCGVEFLQAERRGVLLLLVADLTDNKKRIAVEQILDTNIVREGGNRLNANEKLGELVNAQLDVHWKVLPLTNPGVNIDPSAVLVTSEGLLPSSNWDAYVTEIQTHFLNSSGQITDPSFGEVLNQDFELYSPSFFEECGGLELPEEYACFRSAVFAQKRLNQTEATQRERDRIEWIVNNPERVEFAATPNNDAAEQYEEWLNTYNQCVNDVIPDIVGFCRSITSIPSESFCRYCTIPEECDPNELFVAASKLPDATIVPVVEESERTDSYDLQDQNSTITSPIDRICVLSRFYGEFNSASDRVEVVADISNNQWTLEVDGSDVK